MKCFKDVLIGILYGVPDDKKIVATVLLILFLVYVFTAQVPESV